MNTPGPFSIGSKTWPGLAKLVEESGELCQVIGKLIALDGNAPGDFYTHWDGTDISVRLQEELADVQAVIEFVREHNPQIESAPFNRRVAMKVARFNTWHDLGQG